MAAIHSPAHSDCPSAFRSLNRLENHESDCTVGRYSVRRIGSSSRFLFFLFYGTRSLPTLSP